MLTITVGGIIVITSSIIEKRARNNGNTDAALSAKRFTRYFIVGIGFAVLVYAVTAATGFVHTMFLPF